MGDDRRPARVLCLEWAPARLRRISTAAGRAVLRRCGDLRPAVLPAGRAAAHRCRPPHRGGERGAHGVGRHGRSCDRRHPVVADRRPDRSGAGHVAVGDGSDRARPAGSVRPEPRTAVGGPVHGGPAGRRGARDRDRLPVGGNPPRPRGARGRDVRRGHQRRWPARAARRGAHRGSDRLADRGAQRGRAVRHRSARLRPARAAVSRVRPVAKSLAPRRRVAAPAGRKPASPHASWRSSLRPSSSWVGSSRCTTSWASA